MSKATKEEATKDIDIGEFEHQLFGASRNHKNRNCIFCEKNIPKDVGYYTHFEYPYMPDQKRWVACDACFKSKREEWTKKKEAKS